MSIVLAAHLLCGVFPAFPDSLRPLAIQYGTSDGVTIGANYYAPKVEKGRKAPVAILVHMYALKRDSWEPLIPQLHRAGFAVLAYDTRGKGESVHPAERNLQLLYGKMDPELFTEAWRDAEGAKKLLAKQAECDVSRMVIIGAAEGVSIAIDYARRDTDVKTVVGLSPYEVRMGLATKSHIREIADRPILLIAPQKQFPNVDGLVAATGGRAKGEMLPGTASQHGTNLLTEPMYADHVRQMILDFICPAVGLSPPSPKSKPPTAAKPGENKPKKEGS